MRRESDEVNFAAHAQRITNRLRGIKQKDVKRMQRNLAAIAPRFVFSRQRATGNALDIFTKRVFADALVVTECARLNVRLAGNIGNFSTHRVAAQATTVLEAAQRLAASDTNRQISLSNLRRARSVLESLPDDITRTA